MSIPGAAPGDLLRLERQVSDTRRDRSIERSEQQRGSSIPGECCEFPDRYVLRTGRDFRQHRRRTVEEGSNGFPPPNDIPTTGDHQSLRFDPHFPCGNRAQPAPDIEIGNRPRPGMTGEHDQSQSGHPEPRLPGKDSNLAGAKGREIKSPVPGLKSPVRTRSSAGSTVLLEARSSQLAAGDWRLATGDSRFSCHFAGSPIACRRSAGHIPYRTYVRFASAVS